MPIGDAVVQLGAWTTEEYMLAATANDCGATANATISQATAQISAVGRICADISFP